MSETIDPKQAQIDAAKAAAARLAARIDELKPNIGRTFRRKDGTGGLVKVLEYAGVRTKDGVSSHTLRVESREAHQVWTPPAVEFLADYEIVTAPETATATSEIQ